MKPLRPDRLALIGASTGGPAHIHKILTALPIDAACAVVIGQHMNMSFIPSFIKQLNHHAPIDVLELLPGTAIEAGKAYIATGKVAMEQTPQGLRCSSVTPVADHFNPDINHLFLAFEPYVKAMEILGVILTGIGEDGVKGCTALARGGARCIAESERSAIVYGMPQRAREQVPNIDVQSIETIISSIQEFAR